MQNMTQVASDQATTELLAPQPGQRGTSFGPGRSPGRNTAPPAPAGASGWPTPAAALTPASEASRGTIAPGGLGGPDFHGLRGVAMTGTWNAARYTDPDRRAYYDSQDNANALGLLKGKADIRKGLNEDVTFNTIAQQRAETSNRVTLGRTAGEEERAYLATQGDKLLRPELDAKQNIYGMVTGSANFGEEQKTARKLMDAVPDTIRATGESARDTGMGRMFDKYGTAAVQTAPNNFQKNLGAIGGLLANLAPLAAAVSIAGLG